MYKQIGNMSDDHLRKLAIASRYDTEIDRFVWLTAAIPAPRAEGDLWPNTRTTLLVSVPKLDVWPGLLMAQGGAQWRLDPTFHIIVCAPVAAAELLTSAGSLIARVGSVI